MIAFGRKKKKKKKKKKTCARNTQMSRSIPQARFLNLAMLKGLKKYEKKEQGNIKQEEPRSNSHKATQSPIDRVDPATTSMLPLAYTNFYQFMVTPKYHQNKLTPKLINDHQLQWPCFCNKSRCSQLTVPLMQT